MSKRLRGLHLPTLGYGCYGLGGAYGKPPDAPTAVQLLKHVYDLGIRYFDTADGYGETEALLGKALKFCRQDVCLATKVSPGKGGPDLSRAGILNACESSLRKLDTDYIDVYQVHFDDPRTPISETVAALEELQKAGKIRSFGVGHLPLPRVQEYLEISSPTTVLVEMNAISVSRYNELQPLLQRHDFSVIAFSATARGLLTGKITERTVFTEDDIRSLDPQFRGVKRALGVEMAQQLKRIARELGKTPSQLAIAWVLAQTGVDIVLIGPKNPLHLEENCDVLYWQIEAGTLRELNNLVAQHTARVKAQVRQEVNDILSKPLHPCPPEAAKDLIYALEFLAEEGVINESISISLFRQLFAVAKGKISSTLGEIQDRLRQLPQK